jgi:hypothetical protein
VAKAVERDHHKPKSTLFVEEKLRRLARGATRQIVTRRGRGLNMWIGSGYPKSGTVWLCKLMGTALGLPVPLDFQMPIMMPSVIHAHWRYDERFGPAMYIRRDGRDVVVSMYFHWTRGLRMNRDPGYARRLAEIFDELYGPSFDPEDTRGNMPKFIEYQMTEAPSMHGITWQENVRDWWGRPRVGHVTYESLLSDPTESLFTGLAEASGEEPNREAVELAVQRHQFTVETGRTAGSENRGSFLRKGIAGDWQQHFTREAGEVFDAYAGADLVEFGYESDRDWFLALD